MKLEDIFKLQKCINCNNVHVNDFLCIKTFNIFWHDKSINIYKDYNNIYSFIEITDANLLEITYIPEDYIIYKKIIDNDFHSLNDIINFIDNAFYVAIGNLIFL